MNFGLFSDSFETLGRTLLGTFGALLRGTLSGLFSDSSEVPGPKGRETLCGAGPIATLATQMSHTPPFRSPPPPAVKEWNSCFKQDFASGRMFQESFEDRIIPWDVFFSGVLFQALEVLMSSCAFQGHIGLTLTMIIKLACQMTKTPTIGKFLLSTG